MRIEARQGRSHRVYGMSPRRRFRPILPSGAAARRGFTIVELLVAMMMFAVGMLALASTAASVTKMMGGAKRQTIAAQVAQSRIERLRSSPCSTIASGADTGRGVISTWTVVRGTRSVAVTEVVTYKMSRAQSKSRTYMTTLSCAT